MSHAVLILAHNNLELTQRAIASVQQQDIPTEIFVVDNGSTDGTTEWLSMLPPSKIKHWTFRPQLGVSAGWNYGLQYLFRLYDHVLVLNNDVELPPWGYRFLLHNDVSFVTGVAVDYRPTEPAMPMPLTPNPDFSCFLIWKDAWMNIGPFNEDMKYYASDCCYHVRGHRLGIPMMKANVPYFHASSSTLKNADPEERAAIQKQADCDRQVFRDIYGCVPGEAAYDDLFR